jgi:hypothetical protein
MKKTDVQSGAEKKNTTKAVAKKAIESPFVSDGFAILASFEVAPVDKRVIWLLQARPDFSEFFIAGQKAMVNEYKPTGKDKNPFDQFFFYSCLGFVDTITERSITAVKKEVANFDSVFGIGSVLRNRKGDLRVVVNMIPTKDKKGVDVVWYDPTQLVAVAQSCSHKTMMSWATNV